MSVKECQYWASGKKLSIEKAETGVLHKVRLPKE